MTDDKDKKGRVVPQNTLDLNLMTTNTVWGTENISPSLKQKLRQFKTEPIKEDGTVTLTQSDGWELLNFYTRDLRLANLSAATGELAYCQYYLDLAGDMLQENYIKPFLICLSRVATILELSQSKGGFLRKRMNTLTQEQHYSETGPQKKKFFSGKKEV